MSMESGPGPKAPPPAFSQRAPTQETSGRPQATPPAPPTISSKLASPARPFNPREQEATHGQARNNDKAQELGPGAGQPDSVSPPDEEKTLLVKQRTEGPEIAQVGGTSTLDWNPDGSGRAHFLGDARIRNPIPSKLQSQLSEKDGNFSVMHMGVQKTVIDARDLAAKRTSELTQAAALQATKNGYQSIKRSKLAWPPLAPAPKVDARLPYHLSPEAVRSEQARILTLVRSLHPTLVVDQLCRALSYFGGVPGTPSSPDLTFPDSDKRNGSGKNFVGWLAEIFPPMDLANLPQPAWIAVPASEATPEGGREGGTDQNKPDTTGPSSGLQDHASADGTTTPQKRPRGRPKGSKSTKVRKDKGLKKGERLPVEGSVEGDLETQLSQSVPLPQPTVPAHSLGPAHLGDDEVESSSIITPSGKKRGRPKGSKNRPKLHGAEDGTNTSLSSPAPKTAAPTALMSIETPTQETSAVSTEFQTQPQPHGLEQSSQSTLSQHAQSWTGQSARDDSQPSQSTSTTLGSSPVRKRKPSMHLTQTGNPASSEARASDGHRPTSVSPTLQRTDQQMAQRESQSIKRRRMSKEQGQPMVPMVPPPNTTRPNASSVQTAISTVPSPSTASSAPLVNNNVQDYSSQSSRPTQPPNLMHMRQGPWSQQQQQQYLQMQRQHQHRAQQMARQAAGLDLRNEGQPGSAHSVSSGSFIPPSSQESQRVAARSQQKPGTSQSQTQPSLSYTGDRGSGSYHTESASGPPQAYAQAPSAGPSPYPGFAPSDPAYLGMQYALGATRAVQSSANVYGTQLGENPLDAATLAQTDMPNRMYTNFGRRA